MVFLKKTVGLDIGKGAIQIAILKNDKLVKTHIIQVVENDSTLILQQLKRFLKINNVNSAKVNVLIKDYRTKRIKIERLRGKDLKNALLFEREEKIGTTEILGENYKDNHIIQKSTNNALDILLTVVNNDEIETLESFLREIGIKDVNYYMEGFIYNDISPDNSVIVDIGYSSIQVMFFDRKKIVKTSLMKKGISDIIEELKDKVDSNIKFKDFMKFTLADQDDEKYDIVTSKLGLYAENIINGINTFARENSKNLKSMNIFYTGGIFSISGMAEYFKYLMGVEGKILKVYGGKEEPLYNNSIALAYKDGEKGRISLGLPDLINKISKAASYVALILTIFVLIAGAYRYYEYYTASNENRIVEKAYTDKKKVYDSISADYNRMAELLGTNQDVESKNAKKLSDILEFIETNISDDISIRKLEMNSNKTFIIDGSTDNYTNYGIFCTQLRKLFSDCKIKTIDKSSDKTVVFRLECRF